jgi:hypothetical protein
VEKVGINEVINMIFFIYKDKRRDRSERKTRKKRRKT